MKGYKSRRGERVPLSCHKLPAVAGNMSETISVNDLFFNFIIKVLFENIFENGACLPTKKMIYDSALEIFPSICNLMLMIYT